MSFDYNAEHPHRPGVSFGENLADKALTMAVNLLMVEPLISKLRELIRDLGPGEPYYNLADVANDLEQIVNRADLTEARALLRLRETVEEVAAMWWDDEDEPEEGWLLDKIVSELDLGKIEVEKAKEEAK